MRMRCAFSLRTQLPAVVVNPPFSSFFPSERILYSQSEIWLLRQLCRVTDCRVANFCLACVQVIAQRSTFFLQSVILSSAKTGPATHVFVCNFSYRQNLFVCDFFVSNFVFQVHLTFPGSAGLSSTAARARYTCGPTQCFFREQYQA